MRYGVLGPVEARVDDQVIAIGGPQQRRMLALLLQRPGQAVSTDRMVDCLWNDGEVPEGAARSVMTYVSRLRSALGDEAIERVHDGYRLVLNGSALDVGEFESCLARAESAEPGRAMDLYDQALALWRGDAYGELGHEWWLVAEAERLNEMRLMGMEERVEVMVALGQHQRAIPDLNWMRSSHPLRERPVALLMRSLLASGRQADALREYQAYRAALAEETGLEPSADLQALERSIAVGRAPAPQGGRLRSLRGYTVLAVLGEGAYGRVLAATQPGTNRDVAIKVIRPDLADDSRFVRRFEAEAQLVARLEHPHIVPLYDYWREPGGAYLVFRLLSGGTAEAALVSGGAFDVARVSRIVEEVGSALLAAHTAGVVHCDVKPSNVLFDALGNSYLSDFGIALASSSGDDGGSHAYDVPEIADHHPDTVQSDIFSFGCMLWELLADESARAVTNIQPQAPVAARAQVRRLPSLAGRIGMPSAAIDAVIARATEPDPAMRFESMAELIVAWRAAIGRDEGVLTPIDQPRGPFTSSSRRREASVLSAEIAASVNPYKGLRPFAEADAEDFFGRDDVAGVIRDALAVRHLVAIVGPSGSGKSSVVGARLVPMLRNEGARIAAMVPGEHPCVSLRQALRSVATGNVDSDDELRLIDAAVAGRGGDLVLVVDQFEECWTLAGTAEREHFLSALAHAVSRRIRCVVTVRADLYDRPLRDQLVGQLVADGTFPLPPLTPEALEEAVVRPARRHGVEFDEGVATSIVAEAAAHPAGLPLLQFALAELYERRTDGHITADALHDMGGVGGAVGRRAEDTYQALTPELQAHARELFARLVAPGMGSPDTRRRARFGELSEPARDVADRFVAARLLVADRDHATREPVVEVAHEALLTNWPRLREWLNDDRTWIAQLQHLASASRGWIAGDTDAELYRGSRLEGVLEAIPERSRELNAEELAFVEASRQGRDAERDRERRNNRRLRRLLAAAVCLVLVAIVAGVFAYNRQVAANRSRRSAEITTLTSRSEAIRSSNRDAAALLAIEANRLRADNESRAALFATFTRDPGFLGYRVLAGAEGARVQGALVPNSNTAVVSIGYSSPDEADSPLRTVDLTTGEMGPPFPAIDAHDYVTEVAVSADGRVAVGYGGQIDNGTNPREAMAFDVATGRPIGPRIIMSDNVDGKYESFNVAVNADGTQIAVAGGDAGSTRIFDLRTGDSLTTIDPASDMQESFRGLGTATAAWAPDGSLYVGSSGTHMRQFDPRTFELLRDITVPAIATGGTLQFSDDGSFLVAGGGIQSEGGGGPQSAARIDLANGSNPWTIGPEAFPAQACDVFAFSAPDDRLWCADFSGVIRGRSLSTGELDGTTVEHQRGGLTSLAVQSVGGHRYLVAFALQSPIIGLWQIDGGGPITRTIADGYDFAEYSPDGRRLLVAKGAPVDPPGFVAAVWDPIEDRPLLTLEPELLDVVWLDGDRLGAVTLDGRGRVIDVRTGAARTVPIDVEPGWIRIARVADGRIAFGYPDGHIDVFDFDAARHLVTIKPSRPSDPGVLGAMTPSVDGTRLYVDYSPGLGVYEFDLRDGRQLAFHADTSASSVASASGAPLAIGHLDGSVSLHDPDDLSVIGTLPGARSYASVTYDDEGRFLVVNGGGTFALYDVARRQRMGDPIDVGDVNVDLRPDGMQIVLGPWDTPDLTLWDLDPSTMTDAACHIAGRNLSHAEWETYVGDLAPYHATCPEFPVPDT